MAKNLLSAGYDVIGHNRSQGPVNDLVDSGGAPADSAKEATENADVIITCLPNTDTVSEIVHSEEGILSGVSGGETVIDMSTISPVETEEIADALAEHDVDMLDAPISGGEEGAIDGSLSIMVGGDEAVLEEYRPIFEAMGERITYCGPNGAGQVTKACNQIVVSNTLEAIGEALVFAEKAGADLEAVIEAISGGAAGCWALDNRAPSMIRGDFEPGFFASYQHKDLRIATDAGEVFGAPMPVTETTRELYKAMKENGMGKDDNSGIIQIIEMLGGEQARIDN
nr:NAD(P)-dependent oxidoreductase [Natronococcus sp. CG52]